MTAPCRTPTEPRLPIPRGLPKQFALDLEALLAVLVDDKARPALAEFGIDVFVPEIERLQNVAVGIDNVIRTGHRQFLRCNQILRHGNATADVARG